MSHMPIVMNCSGHIELHAVSNMCHSFQQMYFEIIDLTPLSFTTSSGITSSWKTPGIF